MHLYRLALVIPFIPADVVEEVNAFDRYSDRRASPNASNMDLATKTTVMTEARACGLACTKPFHGRGGRSS